MRYLIAREGVMCVVPNYFNPESLTWEEDAEIIVVWQANWDDPDSILGVATDLKREESGIITAEVEWSTPKGQYVAGTVDRDLFLTIYCDEVAALETGGVTQVNHARIKGIFATNGDPWKERTNG